MILLTNYLRESVVNLRPEIHGIHQSINTKVEELHRRIDVEVGQMSARMDKR